MAKKKAPQPAKLSFEEMKKLALAGAEATLARLRQEVQILERTFPELATTRGRAKLAESAGNTTREWSNAARKAAGLRMKRYWAARKRAEAKK